MPEPLDYATPPQALLPHSQWGWDSLTVTVIWLACAASTLIVLTIARFAAAGQYVFMGLSLSLAVLTLMAMLVFVPLGFILALYGLTERGCRHTYTYVGALFNGAVLMIAGALFMWDRF